MACFAHQKIREVRLKIYSKLILIGWQDQSQHGQNLALSNGLKSSSQCVHYSSSCVLCSVCGITRHFSMVSSSNCCWVLIPGPLGGVSFLSVAAHWSCVYCHPWFTLMALLWRSAKGLDRCWQLIPHQTGIVLTSSHHSMDAAGLQLGYGGFDGPWQNYWEGCICVTLPGAPSLQHWTGRYSCHPTDVPSELLAWYQNRTWP